MKKIKRIKNLVCRVQLQLIAHYKKEQSPVFINNWGRQTYMKKSVRDILEKGMHAVPGTLYENTIYVAIDSGLGFWVGKNRQNNQYEAFLEIEYLGEGRILKMQIQEIRELLDLFEHAQKLCEIENEKLL